MIPKNPVLVKFRASEHFISIRTVTHSRKSPSWFDLPRERFTDLEAEGRVTVRDGSSFADFRLTGSGTLVEIDFTWLARHDDGTAHGFAQTVTLDYDELAGRIWDSLDGGSPAAWSMLSVDRLRPRPQLDFGSEGGAAHHPGRPVRPGAPPQADPGPPGQLPVAQRR